MDLYEILHSIHGQENDGTGTTIRRGDRYLSGTPYLWSSFGERAYIFPSREYAEALIAQFPEELYGATVHQSQPEKEDD